MKPILDGLRALGAARLVALGVVGVAMLAMLALLAARGGTGSTHMSLLYADLDPREAAQIAEALDRAHVPHQEPGAGDRVLVPGEQVARARMLLAKDGLPSGGSIGYEIFDRSDAMTASDFQQEINQTRALEGELARSIRMLTGVRAARVHVVLPRRQPFAHDTQPAQASVVLTMAGAARLDSQGVQAVLNLVAAAVPGLKPQGISVIDSRGMVLARAGQPTGEDEAITSGEELKRATEAKLSRAIEDMLERTLGVGHVRAEVAAEMNFEHVNETTESYDPNQQVVRSTQTVTDKNKSTDGEKNVSVQNNLPNADAGTQAQTGSSDDRNEETTNYEIGRTVRTLVRAQPQISRLSVAVMVDGVVDQGADGKVVWRERNEGELSRIKELVQSAVGFDAKRGDTVNVVSLRFVEEAAGDSAGRGLFGLGLEKADMLGLAQSSILGLVVLLTLLFVVRPMALRLAVAGPGADESMLADAAGGMAVAGLAAGGGGGVRALPAPGGGGALVPADDAMVDLANIEGQMRASSLRKLAEMVERHPDETLSIMRSWMNQER
jgi:flagellar M-ring protein FliF